MYSEVKCIPHTIYNDCILINAMGLNTIILNVRLKESKDREKWINAIDTQATQYFTPNLLPLFALGRNFWQVRASHRINILEIFISNLHAKLEIFYCFKEKAVAQHAKEILQGVNMIT